MKNFLLEKKFIGVLAVLIFVISASAYISGFITQTVRTYSPTVAQEMKYFLSITIQNGEIVSPKNTVLKRSYGTVGDQFNVVLDTRVDEFKGSELQNQGVYISRKYIYGVQKLKTEIRSLSEFGDAVINDELLDAGVNYLNENIDKISFCALFVVITIVSIVVILLATLLLHWLMAMLFKVPFSRTLRLNTLTFVVIYSLKLFSPLHFSMMLMFLIMVAVNLAVNTTLKDQE